MKGRNIGEEILVMKKEIRDGQYVNICTAINSMAAKERLHNKRLIGKKSFTVHERHRLIIISLKGMTQKDNFEHLSLTGLILGKSTR